MPAITETSDAPTDGKADMTQTTAAEVSTDSTGPVDNSASTAPQVATESEENSSKPTTNGPVDPAGTQNGECKSPLEGKELEESIPGLAQAKELAETLVSEDGSGIDPKSREVVLNACKAVGSISTTSFDIRFNPDIFSPGVRFPEDALEDIQKQKQLLKDAAAFLVTCQVPSLVRTVLEFVDKTPAKAQLEHFYVSLTPKLGIHFLNCFLSSFPDAVAHLPADELVSRRKSRKRRNRVPGGGDNTAWASLTPSELWKNIAAEAQSYYHFKIQW
ncbi:hypothetical protein GOODEAATRI_002815 [Goodea atripinnis]|uniref:CLU central domain-containing protein n=1 Tax=Goodea atripinnis TaxID=208336 RepID=A0ABV0MY71_9TELE